VKKIKTRKPDGLSNVKQYFYTIKVLLSILKKEKFVSQKK